MRRPPHHPSFRFPALATLALLLFLLSACGGARENGEKALSAGEDTSGVVQRVKVALQGAPGTWRCAYKVVGSDEDSFSIREKEAFLVYPVGKDWELDVVVATAPNRAKPVDGDRRRDRLPAGRSERFGIRSVHGTQNKTWHKIDMICYPPDEGTPIVPDHDPELSDSLEIMSEDEIEPTAVPPAPSGGPVMEIDD